MSALAEFNVPAAEFVLAETLTVAPDMRIEIMRVVGGDSTVTPYFWASKGDFDRFERALRTDEMVQDVMTLEEHDAVKADGSEDERFYRVVWRMEVPNLISAVSEAKATVLNAVTEGRDTWDVTVLFPDDGALSAFHSYCQEHGFTIEPTRIYQPENPKERAEFGITEEQQEALEETYHAGYFSIPRDHTMTEVADELGISRNALSARLRRGLRNLLANTIIHEE